MTNFPDAREPLAEPMPDWVKEMLMQYPEMPKHWIHGTFPIEPDLDANPLDYLEAML